VILSVLILCSAPADSFQQSFKTEREETQQKVSKLEAERPNIIFFLSDDQRWDRMGCAGHPFLKTPTMDRLASSGVRFSNMLVTTPICAASRASILTGMYERAHRYTFGRPPLAKNFIDASYPVQLRAAGYRTGFTGKFGVKVFAGERQRMFDYFEPISNNPYLQKQPDGSLRHESELCGDRAIEFLKSIKTGQPFCLSVSFNAAHAADNDKRPGIGHFPWPKSVDGLYEDVEIPEPRLSSSEIFSAHPDFLKKSLNRERFFWRWDTVEKYRKNIRAYYRMITGIDNVMGRVLDELKKLGLDGNTIIIFSGDNGYYEAQRGFAGKWSHYDESLRVPLIIYDPRTSQRNRGQVLKQMALNLDIPATILHYAGIDIPKDYQGRSLVSLVNGNSPQTWRTDTLCEHLMDATSIPKWEGVRSDRYVYVRYFQQTPVYEFLHDLQKDPDQLSNLVNEPTYAEQLKRMRTRCDQLREQQGG